jgi:cobalamin-dependent methionine synthase I
MADFIAPKETHINDYVGMFAVSAGFKEKEICE